MNLSEIKEKLDSIETGGITAFVHFLQTPKDRIAYIASRAEIALRYVGGNTPEIFNDLLAEVPAEPTLGNFERLKGLIEGLLAAGYE